MITYRDSVEGVSPEMLEGFFVGWPNPPSPETHLRVLQGSDRVILAVDEGSGRVVGFITAITDGVLSAYIPLLEVLPEYQKQGIGSELVRRMLAALVDFYKVDLVCEAELRPFYERFGMKSATAMLRVDFSKQRGIGG